MVNLWPTGTVKGSFFCILYEQAYYKGNFPYPDAMALELHTQFKRVLICNKENYESVIRTGYQNS